MSGPDGVRDVGGVYEALSDGRYRAYPGYKDSGVEWLGEIPSHWKLLRLKFQTRLINEKVEPNNELEGPYIGMEHIASWTGKLVSFDGNCLPEGLSNTFCSGDLLFGKLRPYLAKAFAAKFNGLCSSELIVLRPREMDQSFLFYVLLSDGFIKLVDSSTYGAKMPRANWEFIGNIRIPIPAIPEQKAITHFLDTQTKKIDDLIAAKRELLALFKEKRQAVITHAVTKGLDPNVKFKPSGIDWLRDVPEHWTTPPLYSRYEIELGKMLNEQRIKGDWLVPYLRNVDVQWDRLNTNELPEMDISPSEQPRFTVRKGDLLVCEGGEVGRCAIWNDELPLCGFQKAIHRLRPLHLDEIPRYLFFVMRTAASRGVFEAGNNPNTIAHLTREKLRRYHFPKPPKHEQNRIVEYLNAETAKIDELSNEVETAISKLHEYRTALISAAVTGKIDVRGYAS